MKRAKGLLVSLLLAGTVFGASIQPASAYVSHTWANTDDFVAPCIGFNNSIPWTIWNVNAWGFASLGYSVSGSAGPAFTRSAFLGSVLSDWAVYVHSHGYSYSGGSEIRSDPGSGRCSGAWIDSSEIKAATQGSPYNLVIMSTCYLGDVGSAMPDAFQIEKIKGSTQREFFLGYRYSTWDSSQLRFERAFWSYVEGSSSHTRSLSMAFNYALSIGGYEDVDPSDPFAPNWWGNAGYNGTPG